MKYLLLILLLFFVIQDALYCVVLRSQKNKEPFGKPTQTAVRVLENNDLITNSHRFIESDFVQQAFSTDWSLVLSSVGRQVKEEVLYSPHPMESLALVPKNAILVVDTPDATATGKNFFTSHFGQALSSIDWISVLHRLKIKKRFHQVLKKNTFNVSKLLENPFVTKIFSTRVVLAQLPALPDLFQNDVRKALLENLLVLIHSGRDDSRSLLPVLFDLIKGKKEIFNYHGMTINALTLTLAQNKKKVVYIASVGQHIAVSFGLKPVQQSINLFINGIFSQNSGLSSKNDYKEIQKHGFSENALFLYADLFKLKSQLSLLRTLSDVRKKKQAPQTHHQDEGTKSLGFFHRTDKRIGEFRAVTHFSSDQLHPFQQRIYTRTPVHNRGLGKMPADLLIYLWCNWLEPQLWWQTTIAQGKKGELAAASRIAAWVKEQTGMSMDTFLSLFGREFGFNVAEISTAGFFPAPRICFIIEVLDTKKLESFFKKIISGLPVRRDKVAGIPVVSLMAANGMMQPSYAFTDNRLLLADSREQIEDILLSRKKTLPQDTTFQAVDRGMEKPSNLKLFARTAELADAMQELASWAGTMIAVRDHKAGAKSKVLVDQVISPLLDGFKMYQAIGMRSYTAPGELIVDAAVLRAKSAHDAAKKSPAQK
ncbi:MAG: hypothetical protein D3924_04595 [Candidatus Electrothrix sp. AR4]|nr:hypothetical protein [Candidatus Electrothrix sp. AR4]